MSSAKAARSSKADDVVLARAVLNSRQLATFALRVDRVINSLPNSENMARAIIDDWLGREQARDIAEVERCLENCAEHEREYWREKLDKVRYGESWQRGNPFCDLTWPEDDLDKAVRALAIRDFCWFGDHKSFIHPKCGHYAHSLADCTPATINLNDCLEALLGQLRSMVGDWNGVNSVPRPSDEKSVLRGWQPAKEKQLNVGTPPSKPTLGTPTGVPALSERQQHVLVASLELAAFDSDSRRTAQQIVERTDGKLARADLLKKTLSALVGSGHLQRKRGSGGGYWLTENGRERAEKLAKS